MDTSPKYQQVARDLMQGIESGRIAVGDTLPTEAQLCQHYGVSRITVRAAMSTLSEKGLVRRMPGVGTHVLRRHSPTRFVHTSDSLDSVLQFTESTRFRLLEHFWTDLPANGGPGGAPLGGGRRLCARGLRMDPEGQPVCLTDLHLLAVHQAMLEDLDGLRGSVMLRLEQQFGVSLHAIEQAFDVALLTAPQARALECKRADPAMRVQRWHQDAKGNTLIYSINLYPSDRYLYRLRMQRSAGEGAIQ
jgi:GntR family transcriptional regulator